MMEINVERIVVDEAVVSYFPRPGDIMKLIQPHIFYYPDTLFLCVRVCDKSIDAKSFKGIELSGPTLIWPRHPNPFRGVN